MQDRDDGERRWQHNAAGILLWRKNLTELHIISETILHTLHKALSQLRYLNIRKTSILNNM